MDGADLTQGHLLNGRIDYAQPKDGYRTGIEPVFLAAVVPARPGERVLEAGTGAGAGLLCLTARVAGITGLGIEIEPRMAAVATGNFITNGRSGLGVLTADIRDLAADPSRFGGSFDHAMANPPWHAASGTRSAVALRARAKVAEAGVIANWTRALGQALRYRGSLTLILPARALPEALAALPAAGCGSPRLFPLWPRAGVPARIIILQAIRGGRADFRAAPGLVLHEGAAYTPAAEAVLRDGAGLPLG
jgi:tRNA1(Val) A37 N6-methylase TrmN6